MQSRPPRVDNGPACRRWDARRESPTIPTRGVRRRSASSKASTRRACPSSTCRPPAAIDRSGSLGRRTQGVAQPVWRSKSTRRCRVATTSRSRLHGAAIDRCHRDRASTPELVTSAPPQGLAAADRLRSAVHPHPSSDEEAGRGGLSRGVVFLEFSLISRGPTSCCTRSDDSTSHVAPRGSRDRGCV